ncbi:hypothetical protein [Actinomycetospora flava]|uniref:DUF4185 domain-containing protein n=1 Tax=Actinomycetospora flava TaxID=3129232 RepID=A0ABU8M6M4_9PSEU
MTITSTGRHRSADTGPRTGGDTGPTRYVRIPERAGHAVDQSFVPTAVPSQRPAASPITAPWGPARSRPATGPHTVAPAPAPAPAPARSWTLTLWAAGGLVVGLLGVLAMLLVIGWPSGPASDQLPGHSTSAVAAEGSRPAASPGTLAAAFPDVTALGDRCTPYRVGAAEYVTSTGAHPVAVVLCDYGAAVPGGFVYYTEWSTAADAQQWHDDQRSWGPSLDGMPVWGHGVDQRQGPLHRRAAPDGTVYATGAYSGRPYTFDIVTRSLEDSNRMFPAMNLQPGDRLPAGR